MDEDDRGITEFDTLLQIIVYLSFASFQKLTPAMNAKTAKTTAKTLLKQLKDSPLLLPVGGSIALIASGTVAFWALTRPNFAPGTLPIGSNVIPQDALMVLSMSTDPNQWRQLRSFGTAQSQGFLDQNIAQVRDRFLFDNGLDYERDIQPWVGGEASFALLSPQGETLPPAEGTPIRPANPQPAVLVLPIQDGLKAKELLEKPREGQSWNRRKYKDIEIQESQSADTQTSNQASNKPPKQSMAAAAIDGKFLLVTNSTRAIEQAIDTYKGSNSIANLPGYTNALGQIQTGPSFATLYMNLPAMVQQGGRSAPKREPNKDLSAPQGWAMTVTLQNEGLNLKSILWLNPDSKRTFSTNNDAKTMSARLPTEAVMSLSGGNLKQFWTEYSRDYGANPIKVLDPASFKQEVRGAINMDLEQDFMPWMEGEFSMSLLPAPAGSSPMNPVAMVLMVQASDRRAADKALTQLDETMARKYNFKVEPSKVSGQDVVNWKLPNGEPSVTRGWLDNNVAFLSLGGPVASTFMPRPAAPLTNQTTFKQVTADPKTARSGEVFIDLEKAATYKNLPLLRFPLSNQFWTDAIRSIGVTIASTSDRTIRYDSIVLLKQGAAPGVLPSPTVKPSPMVKPSPTPSSAPKKK